jgi:hypothetical protein
VSVLERALNAPIDFEAVKAAARTQLLGLVSEWLPGGKLDGDEWVALNPTRADQKAGSFKVNIHIGLWSDFATGDAGGDAISLLAYIEKKSQVNAAKILAVKLGLRAESAIPC